MKRWEMTNTAPCSLQCAKHLLGFLGSPKNCSNLIASWYTLQGSVQSGYRRLCRPGWWRGEKWPTQHLAVFNVPSTCWVSWGRHKELQQFDCVRWFVKTQAQACLACRVEEAPDFHLLLLEANCYAQAFFGLRTCSTVCCLTLIMFCMHAVYSPF